MTNTPKTEAAEWEQRAKQYRDTLYRKQHMLYIGEKQDFGQLCEDMRNACDAIDALIENATHQRQQAVADFAREVVALHPIYDINDKPHVSLDDIRTLLEQRGIEL